MLKALTSMEKTSFAQVIRTMFSGGCHRVKRMHPTHFSTELQVEGAVRLGTVVLR